MSKAANVVAIDGPSGSGKSTITKIIAKKCNLTYLDTGAMFRAIAFHLSEQGITPKDSHRIYDALSSLKFEYNKAKDNLVEIDGVNLTDDIRQHHVSSLASTYGQVESIRNFLKEFQRKVAQDKPAILEGRDIGTVVFPNAILKFFLKADARIRAERRVAQLKEISPDEDFDVESILIDIKKRDYDDENREIAPLKKAADALLVDSTNKTIDEIVELIVQEISKIPELKS